MGFQVRKRTKGKTGWLNLSFSKQRGLGASVSLKVGENVTYNTRGRLTINLGSGMKYVFYKKKPKQKASSSLKAKGTASPNIDKAANRRPVIQYEQVYAEPIAHDCHLAQIQELLLEIRKMKGLKKIEDFKALGNLNRIICRMRALGRSQYFQLPIESAAQRFETYLRKTESGDLIGAAVAIREMLEWLRADVDS